jgi:predicted nucleic acid-binding protein
MIAYVETSAAAKLFKDEKNSAALKDHLSELRTNGHGIASSALLETELRRTAVRQGVAQVTVTDILDRIDISDISRSMFAEAGVLPDPYLRSLDALHVVAALRMNADVMITYDDRQIEAAGAAGLHVHSPK